MKVVYKLDGSESTNMMPGRQGGEPTPQVSKAMWDGAKLNITTTINFNGNAIEIKRIGVARRRQPGARDDAAGIRRRRWAADDDEGRLQEELMYRTRRALTLAIGATALVAAVAAQSRPNFAGVWVHVPEPGRGPSVGQMVIRHTPTELVLERESPAGPQKTVYKLDGTPSTNRVPSRSGPPTVTTSTAAWEGNTLVIHTPLTRGEPPNTRTIQFKQVISLSPEGRLVIDQTASLNDGAPAETNRLVFQKTRRGGRL